MFLLLWLGKRFADKLRDGDLVLIDQHAAHERVRMQRLLAVRRTEDGHEERDLGGVIFVPLLAGLS